MSDEGSHSFKISVGNGNPLVLIAGPCVLETEEIALKIAERVKPICDSYKLPFIFKSSFDKANRTSSGSYRGPGLEKGLEMLANVKSRTDLPILTDIHEPSQAREVAVVADIIQIPAFLCRQTDLLEAAGATGIPVNIKKGQFMAPEDMKYAIDKVRSAGGDVVTLTERGASFGYRNLVVDLRSIVAMRKFAPVIFDGTHSVQSPGSNAGVTGGDREMVPILTRGAVAAGVDGLFLEIHTDPDSSPSDAANMITPSMLEQNLPLWLEIDARVKDHLK